MPMTLENAFSILNYADRVLWLITAQHQERRGGLIATFVQTASIVPQLPRVVVGIAKHHHTWTLIEQSNRFAMHLLRERNIELVWRFGMQSGFAADKFSGLTTQTSPSGCPLIEDTLVAMECVVEKKMTGGDRSIYLAAVTYSQGEVSEAPLTDKRMLQRATPEQRQLLDLQQRHDAAIDAEAIQKWRARK